MTAVAEQQRVTCPACGQGYRISLGPRSKNYAFTCKKCGNAVKGVVGAPKTAAAPANSSPSSNNPKGKGQARTSNRSNRGPGSENAAPSKHQVTCSTCGRSFNITVPAGCKGGRVTCPGCKSVQSVRFGSNPETAAPAPRKGGGKVWYIRRSAPAGSDKTFGPFTTQRLETLIREGKVKSYDLLSTDEEEWHAANAVSQFVPIFRELRGNRQTLVLEAGAERKDDAGRKRTDPSQHTPLPDKWYVARLGAAGSEADPDGPFEEAEVRTRILSKKIKSYHRIKLGNGDWMQANEAPQFADTFKELGRRKRAADASQGHTGTIPVPPSRTETQDRWYIVRDGREIGPLTEQELRSRVQQGSLGLESAVRKNSEPPKRIADIPFLAELVPRPPQEDPPLPPDATGYYRVLGVGPNASQNEIKKAYFKQVRLHPPEKDPEGFKAVKAAYDQLADEKNRKKYDAMRQYGTEISDLFSRADKCMADENWSEAVRLLKQLLALAPNEDVAANTLGLCYLNAKQIDEAVKIYEKLTRNEPEIAVYWMNFGHAHIEKSEEEGLQESVGNRHRAQARSCFEKVIELEPHNASPYVEIARICSLRGNHQEALEFLEKAVNADGKTDMTDLDALLLMCIIYMRMQRYGDIDKVADRIMNVVPEEEEAKKYVAARFAIIASDLVKVQAFQAANRFLKAAKRFDPNNHELGKFADAVTSMADACDQWEALKDDSTVVEPLRMITLIFLCDALGEELKDRDSAFESWLGALDRYPQNTVASSVNRIQSRYRALYDLHPDFFKKIKEIVTGQRQTYTGGSGGGGCFIATAAFGTPDEPIIEEYRRFRDLILARSKAGRLIIWVYGIVGPILAGIIRRFPILKRSVAGFLASAAPYVVRLCTQYGNSENTTFWEIFRALAGRKSRFGGR